MTMIQFHWKEKKIAIYLVTLLKKEKDHTKNGSMVVL